MTGLNTENKAMTEKHGSLFALLVIAAGVLAYANSFANPFIFDDSVVITDNPDIFHLWPMAMSSRFVVDLSFKLNYAVAGLNVADYHAVNILIHVLAALFLYGVIRRTFALPSVSRWYVNSGPCIAAFCAAVWVAHPLQTQSVTYICQRYASMMGLFFFAALYCFVRGVAGESRQRLWFNLCIGLCAAGMGTKEIMATAPVVILLYDHTFVGPSLREMFRRRWKIYAALALTWLFLAVFQFSFVGESIAAGNTGSRVASSPVSYLLTQFGVITHYIRLTLFPVGLCLDYIWPPAETLREILPYAVLIVTLCAISFVALIKRKPSGFLGTAFFVVLSPTSSVMPIADRAFEHRMYVPLAFVVVFFVVLARNLILRLLDGCRASRRARVIAQCGLCAAALVLLVIMTALRNTDYRSEEAMWRDVVEKRPGNARAYLGLSAGLLKQGRYAEAEEYGRILLSMLPDFAGMNRIDVPDPGQTDEERLLRYRAWLYASAHNNIGASTFNRGEQGLALSHYREAVRIMPDHHDARANLARTYAAAGRMDDAKKEWKEILDRRPLDAMAHTSLGLLYMDCGKCSEAVFHLSTALEASPDLVVAELWLSWLLSTCDDPDVRNGAKAVELAEAVCGAAQNRSATAFDVLAAAYAETGNYERAVKYAGQAVSLLSVQGLAHPGITANGIEAGSTNMREGRPIRGGLAVEDVETRLELYKSGKPYRMLCGKE